MTTELVERVANCMTEDGIAVPKSVRRDDARAIIREMAEWFDNPNESPPVSVHLPPGQGLDGDAVFNATTPWTPGYLLRRIADEMEGTDDE